MEELEMLAGSGWSMPPYSSGYLDMAKLLYYLTIPTEDVTALRAAGVATTDNLVDKYHSLSKHAVPHVSFITQMLLSFVVWFTAPRLQPDSYDLVRFLDMGPVGIAQVGRGLYRDAHKDRDPHMVKTKRLIGVHLGMLDWGNIHFERPIMHPDLMTVLSGLKVEYHSLIHFCQIYHITRFDDLSAMRDELKDGVVVGIPPTEQTVIYNFIEYIRTQMGGDPVRNFIMKNWEQHRIQEARANPHTFVYVNCEYAIMYDGNSIVVAS